MLQRDTVSEPQVFTIGATVIRNVRSFATFTPDRRYRYDLVRYWGSRWSDDPAWRNPIDSPQAAIVAFIGLNPSTADAEKNDPTVKRCMRWAHEWGFHGFVMLNLFAYRATDPSEMLSCRFPIGAENDDIVRHWCFTAHRIVACWGAHGSHRSRSDEVRAMLKRLDRAACCFGNTSAGEPKHPLYLPQETSLVPLPAKVGGE